MIVKGLNSHQKITPDQKHVLICKYVRKKVRPFQNPSHCDQQEIGKSQAQVMKQANLSSFNTLLTKFTNEVKKAIKQQRKLGNSTKTTSECQKQKGKKNNVSMKKIKHYSQIQYETLKKKQYNFNSLQNSILISKKSIGFSIDKNTTSIELKVCKRGESLKNLQLAKNVYQTYPSIDIQDKKECEHKKEENAEEQTQKQKDTVKIKRNQFIPLGKLSQTLPNNYKSYLIENLSRYKDKERENEENPQISEGCIRQLDKRSKKKQSDKINEKSKKKSQQTILANRMEMQREYLKSKKIKTSFFNKSKSKFHNDKLPQDYHTNKQILTGHKYYIFNLPSAFSETRQTIKAKKQIMGISPWMHPNEAQFIDHTP